MVFVVFAALGVHAAGGFEDVRGVEAPEGAGVEDLIHGVLGDHHPPGGVGHGERLAENAIENPYDPPTLPRPGQEPQRPHLRSENTEDILYGIRLTASGLRLSVKSRDSAFVRSKKHDLAKRIRLAYPTRVSDEKAGGEAFCYIMLRPGAFSGSCVS